MYYENNNTTRNNVNQYACREKAAENVPKIAPENDFNTGNYCTNLPIRAYYHSYIVSEKKRQNAMNLVGHTYENEEVENTIGEAEL